MISAALMAAMEQDRAAGSTDLRKLRLKNGEIVTASLKLSPLKAQAGDGEQAYGVTLRFSVSGLTLQRAVGRVTGRSRAAALKTAWSVARAGEAVQKEGWEWVVSHEMSEPRE